MDERKYRDLIEDTSNEGEETGAVRGEDISPQEIEQYREISRAFNKSYTEEPSAEVIAGLSEAAKKAVRSHKPPLWRRWFFSPVLVPVLSSAIAIMLWVNYGHETGEIIDTSPRTVSEQDRGLYDDYSTKAVAKKLQTKGRPEAGERKADIGDDFVVGGAKGRDEAAGVVEGDIVARQDVAQDKISPMKKRREIVKSGEVKDKNASTEDVKLQGSGEGISGGAALFGAARKKPESSPASSVSSPVYELGHKTGRPASQKSYPEDPRKKRAKESKEVAAVSPPGPSYRTEALETEGVLSDDEQTESLHVDEPALEEMRADVGTVVENEESVHTTQLRLALKQQASGDCEASIKTNNSLLGSSEEAPTEVREQAYLSLAQCYEQTGRWQMAIDTYNSLKHVAPTQTDFSNRKIQSLNLKQIRSEPQPSPGAKTKEGRMTK
ncbi:MAG: hypothetical protein V3U74_04745 [Thermodesulfobacteriota bacterium]